MRITHVHRQIRLAKGGVVRAVLDFCSGMAASGHDVTLVAYESTDVPKEWFEGRPGVPTCVRVDPPPRWLGGGGGFFTPAGVKQLEPFVRDADVVHLHGIWTLSNLQIAKLCRVYNKPYVVTPHGMLDDWCWTQKPVRKKVGYHLLAKRFLNEAAFVHCTAGAELEQSAKWFPKGRGRVVPLILDLAPYQELLAPESALRPFPMLKEARERGGAGVLFLSRLHEKKGIEVLIRATALLAQRGVDVTVMVSGTGEPGYVKGLKQMVRALGVEPRVHFLGFISPEDKIRLFQAVDVFVLPTFMENFGFVFFEALASGTPVVTTRVDTWPELTESGGAVIVPDREPESFARAIQGLMNEPERRKAMGKAGRAWVMQNLALPAVASGLERMYQDAVEWKARSGPAGGSSSAR